MLGGSETRAGQVRVMLEITPAAISVLRVARRRGVYREKRTLS